MCKDKLNKKDTEGSNNNLWQTLLLAGFVVLIMWLLSWMFIDLYISDTTSRGTFGDKFGAVNALFSGFAFAGLIVTLLYQKEELKLQREELKETRNELNAQKIEFQEQNKTMKRQRFENTFFNMLSLQQEIVAICRMNIMQVPTFAHIMFQKRCFIEVPQKDNFMVEKHLREYTNMQL